MMRYFVEQGLFEDDGGAITCLKLMVRLDKSMTTNPKIRSFLTDIKVKNKEYSGYVYFIRASFDDKESRIKIGRSKNVTARMAELKNRKDCVGATLTLIDKVKVDDCVSLETTFHRKFKHLNIIDEWFNDCEEISSFIKTELRNDVNSLRTDYDMLEEKRIDKNRTEENRIDKKVTKPKPKKPELDWSVFGEISDEQIEEIKQLRKNKKMVITQRVLSSLAKQINITLSSGYSMNEILDVWTKKSWGSYEHEWFINSQQNNGRTINAQSPQELALEYGFVK